MIDINTGVGNRLGQYDVSDTDLLKAIQKSKANSVITPILCSQKSNKEVTALNLSGNEEQRYDYMKTYVFSPPGTKI